VKQQQQQQQQTLEIKLDEAARELNVEKRRVYDVVNVLESIEAVHKRGMSLYIWNGLDNLSTSFVNLRVSN
jgi:transcription factor E2F7/8